MTDPRLIPLVSKLEALADGVWEAVDELKKLGEVRADVRQVDEQVLKVENSQLVKELKAVRQWVLENVKHRPSCPRYRCRRLTCDEHVCVCGVDRVTGRNGE